MVNRVGAEAEKIDHHPDILINDKRVTFTLLTHSEGGLTQKDLAVRGCADGPRDAGKAKKLVTNLTNDHEP